MAVPGPHDFDPRAFRQGPRRRVLLITIYLSGEMKSEGKKNWVDTMPPLDAAYLGAAARAAGHSVAIMNLFDDDGIAPLIAGKIAEFKPDLIGMPCYMNNLEACFKIASAAKAADPRIHVVLGGPQANASPEICMAKGHVDSIAFGEGEITLCALLGALGSDARMGKVRGLMFRKTSGEILRNPARPQMRDLDCLPQPALDLYPRESWLTKYGGRLVGAILAARGCPFNCTFCATKVVWGRTLRAHTPARVVLEMESLHEQFGLKGFVFYDNTFTARRPWVLELCRLLIRRRSRRFWFCDTRANLVDAELLTAMRKAGCRMVSYGFESGSQRILDSIKKGVSLECAEKAVALTKKAGLMVGGHFIIGFPTETPAETAETVRFAGRLGLDGADFNIAIPFLGTEMFHDAQATGHLRAGYSYEDYARLNSIWVPNGRTRADLERWRQLGLKSVSPSFNKKNLTVRRAARPFFPSGSKEGS